MPARERVTGTKRYLLVFVAMALIVVGIPVSASAASDPVVAAQTLLDERKRAVEQGDAAAFLATIDPSAPSEFRSAQGRLFEGLTSVPMKDVNLRVRLDDSGDLAPGLGLAAKHKVERAFLPETRFEYKLGDYDDRPALDDLWLTFVERNGRWFVASDTDTEVVGLKTARGLWDFGSLDVERTEHFLVLSKAGSGTRGAELAQMAEEAMATFTGRWPLAWSQKIPVIVPGSPEEIRAVLNTPVDVDRFSAFVSYSPVREDGWTTTPPRIYAQEANLAEQSRQRQVADLVHELTHAATSGLTGPFTPPWLHEGLAEYVRLDRSTEVQIPPSHRDRLPNNDDFAGSDAGSIGLAYAEATSVMAFVGRIRGLDGPAELFTTVGRRRVIAGSPSYNLDKAINEATGLSMADFQSGWLAGR